MTAAELVERRNQLKAELEWLRQHGPERKRLLELLQDEIGGVAHAIWVTKMAEM